MSSLQEILGKQKQSHWKFRRTDNLLSQQEPQDFLQLFWVLPNYQSFSISLQKCSKIEELTFSHREWVCKEPRKYVKFHPQKNLPFQAFPLRWASQKSFFVSISLSALLEIFFVLINSCIFADISFIFLIAILEFLFPAHNNSVQKL